MKKSNHGWSVELRRCTLEHYGDMGIVFLKNIRPGIYGIGYCGGLYIPELAKHSIPEAYRDRGIAVFLRIGDRSEFHAVYDSVEDLIADGWVID